MASTEGGSKAGSDKTAESAGKSSDGSRTILIELQRSIGGWGERYDVLEVDPADEGVKGLLANEQAVRVNRSDVTETPQGLQRTDQGHQ